VAKDTPRVPSRSRRRGSDRLRSTAEVCHSLMQVPYQLVDKSRPTIPSDGFRGTSDEVLLGTTWSAPCQATVTPLSYLQEQ
jgi:hypothetical protein